MEDNQIIKLYFERSEQAIKETDTKYTLSVLSLTIESFDRCRAIPFYSIRGTVFK